MPLSNSPTSIWIGIEKLHDLHLQRVDNFFSFFLHHRTEKKVTLQMLRYYFALSPFMQRATVQQLPNAHRLQSHTHSVNLISEQKHLWHLKAAATN